MVEITWRSGSIEEARRISRHLIKERLVFTAAIIPWIESIYLLDGELDTAQESLVTCKAEESKFEEISKLIASMSSFEVPEISKRSIEVNEEFREWAHH